MSMGKEARTKRQRRAARQNVEFTTAQLQLLSRDYLVGYNAGITAGERKWMERFQLEFAPLYQQQCATGMELYAVINRIHETACVANGDALRIRLMQLTRELLTAANEHRYALLALAPYTEPNYVHEQIDELKKLSGVLDNLIEKIAGGDRTAIDDLKRMYSADIRRSIFFEASKILPRPGRKKGSQSEDTRIMGQYAIYYQSKFPDESEELRANRVMNALLGFPSDTKEHNLGQQLKWNPSNRRDRVRNALRSCMAITTQ